MQNWALHVLFEDLHFVVIKTSNRTACIPIVSCICENKIKRICYLSSYECQFSFLSFEMFLKIIFKNVIGFLFFFIFLSNFIQPGIEITKQHKICYNYFYSTFKTSNEAGKESKIRIPSSLWTSRCFRKPNQ